MVQPTNIKPPADSDESQGVQGGPPKKDPTQARTSAPNTDDGSRKPFKEVLDATMGEKQLKQTTKVSFKPDDDDDDVKMSLLDLAAGSSVREAQGKPSITTTAVFRKDGDETIAAVSGDDDTQTPVSRVQIDTRETVRAEDTSSEKIVSKSADLPATPVVAKDHVGARPEGPALQQTKIVDKDKDVALTIDTDTKTVVTEAKKEEKIDPATVLIGANAPLAVHAAQAVNAPAVPNAVTNVREVLLKLAQNMLEQLQQVKASGKTETTLTLRHPPLFAGVEIKVTEFDSAKNQFNLTFSDINNPTARALIEQQDNQAGLRQALLDKGYTLQMLTIEQKIPGLSSTSTQETDSQTLGGRHYDGQTGNATDDGQGNVT